jgi:cysteine desulfurase/selenocysteine lyase
MKQPAIDPEAIRRDFPILGKNIRGKRLVYLDNAATTQKPSLVLWAEKSFYENTNANIHRGIHALSEEATAAYEGVRAKTAAFLNAPDPRAVIFTRNATESINLVARSWARQHIEPGDEILVTLMEHHSNEVPWFMVAKETGARVVFARLLPDGRLDMNDFMSRLKPRTKLAAFTQVSNVLGSINPVREMAAAAHKAGAVVLVDGAQSVPYMPVDFQELGADFLAFSAHKMLGPTGVGVLCANPELLAKMEPFLGGGDMIREVTTEGATWAEIPNRFEAGTPNIAGVVAFGAALEYLTAIGMDRVREHEISLTAYALEKLAAVGGLTIYGPADAKDRGGVVAFNDSLMHPHDLAQFLDGNGIAIRAGHHCAQPLHRHLGIPASARASFHVYNTREDVDMLAASIIEARRYFGAR